MKAYKITQQTEIEYYEDDMAEQNWNKSYRYEDELISIYLNHAKAMQRKQELENELTEHESEWIKYYVEEIEIIE